MHQNTKQSIQKSEHPPHKSIFSCNVYPTTNNYQHRYIPGSSKSIGTSSTLWKDPEVLYVNEKVIQKHRDVKDIKECGTQTSKTILELAQLERGCMSPDSLVSSPRDAGNNFSLYNCPYSVSNHLSDYTLDGSCEEQDCLFNSKKNPTPPSNKFLDKPLTQTFLENKNKNKKPYVVTCFKKASKTNHMYDLKSKALVEKQIYQHPNYIQEQEKPVKLPTFPLRPRSMRRSSRSLDLPDNSFGRRKSSSVSYGQNSFMFPTTASQIKNQMPEIQSTNYLIPPMRRGRSTSPRATNDKRKFECSRKIPYIDQSKSDVSSSTTIINTARFPDRAKLNKIFDDEVLKIEDLEIDPSDLSKSSSQLAENVHPSVSSIDNTISTAVNRFREPDWRIALRGLAEVVEICRVVDMDIIYDYMTSINQRLIELMKSPRSHVCRTACQAAGHFFEYVKDTRRPEFDDIVDLLLHKTADANKFIRRDANLALDCMVTHISPFNSVRALCVRGPFHKNPLVRCATCRLLICTVVIAGPDFVLNPNNNEFTRKRIILNLARFLDDKNLETRCRFICVVMLLQTVPGESGAKPSDESKSSDSDGTQTHILDYAPAPGWTVHVTKEGRLYYCNHVTRTAGWLPPAEAWRCDEDSLPFGWERAVDNSGRPYYINHVNKTTTYETPAMKNLEPAPIPEPRAVTLERSPALGFGFVAGSEKPVIVRFVTEGGPSVDKLLPGDQILSVNGEDVKMAPREHVISLVRACAKSVNLVVCQPPEQQGIRKSTLLSASKRARLRTKPSRVRFAESVCVNGAPLFPPSAFSLGDLCVAPMANVLKVFLENGQTKSFKYDAWTTVHDVVTSLESKLCLQATEHFSLVVEHIKSLKRNKLTLLDPADTLARIASRPGAHKLRCLFRVAFVPPSAAALAQRDLNALDYLYTQCCNDVIQERFAPELQYDTALRLAALHIYQHALANNISAAKLTVKTIEREFGLERFVPASLLENMKRKEVRKLVGHFLKLHSSMAGPGKQLTALQAKLHYLDIVGQLPSYGAKCFSAGPRADALERVILVSPKFGISQITGTRNSVPVPIANIDEMRRIEVRTDDEVTRTVLIRLQNDKTVSISLEERDASELVLVLRGYFRLTTGQCLPVDREESPPMEDLAPPYLSQHKVVPEKWSYTNQISMKTACFAMPPAYQTINKKTNGLYNTMGRQTKPPLMLGYSLDSNMNSSLSNRNHQFNSFDNHSYDLQTVVSMEILESGRQDEVLKRVQEMQQLVENSEKYLTEQANLERLNSLSEWQETSVDIESDTDSILTEDGPGKLKHSDSLLLLNKGGHQPEALKHCFTNAAVELLRSESNQSESDNDSLYTPHNSPKHKANETKANRVSFGLRSPDNSGNKDVDFQAYLQQLRELKMNDDNAETLDSMYVFDPDIIDLTLLPPPATPDELDCALPTPINVPPSSFADSVEKLNGTSDLEEFLASVTVPPPTQKVTPAIELTPEEIMSYIIPPPPRSRDSFENLTITEEEDVENVPEGVKRRNSNCSVKSNIIEYATVDRKGAFSCCAKAKTEKAPIQPLPRRSSDEKPPERPPKNLERQRSQSLTSSAKTEFPPKLPPRSDNNHQAPPHLFLPPKKPPLPPVPPLKKSVTQQPKLNPEVRTAGIGSPHLQRNRNMYSDLEAGYPEQGDRGALARHTTAVSTPTSPYLGRGAHQLTAVPILSPDRAEDDAQVEDKGTSVQVKNGCTSTREILLVKTDVAMASLLVRLDQVAAQCSAAQVHGGGRLISEEKFQIAKEELTSQSLQLVTSSKMLVIAMSDPTLPDLPENLAICLTILRRLTELCQDLTNHTTAPLQTRNLILKVHDVTAAFRHLVTSNVDRSSQKTIEEHLAAQAECLASVLATLLRSLRVFSP